MLDDKLQCSQILKLLKFVDGMQTTNPSIANPSRTPPTATISTSTTSAGQTDATGTIQYSGDSRESLKAG